MEDRDGPPPVIVLACAVKVMAKLKGQREDETLKQSPKPIAHGDWVVKSP